MEVSLSGGSSLEDTIRPVNARLPAKKFLESGKLGLELARTATGPVEGSRAPAALVLLLEELDAKPVEIGGCI